MYDLQEDVSPAIFNARKTVKLFKYSPAKNSPLQLEIIKSETMEPQVILGTVKHIKRMNEKFLKILNPIKSLLRQLKCSHFGEEDCYGTVRDMLNCLKPVRLAVQTLRNHDANLLRRDGILNFLFSNLEKNRISL